MFSRRGSYREIIVFLAVCAFVPAAAMSDEGSGTVNVDAIGCIELDTGDPTLALDPWNAWVTLCEIDVFEGPVRCFRRDETKKELVEDRVYDAALIQSRLKAGKRTCPSITDNPTGSGYKIRD